MKNLELDVLHVYPMPSNDYRGLEDSIVAEAPGSIKKLERDYRHAFQKLKETTAKSLSLGSEGGQIDVYRSWIEYCSRECLWMLHRLEEDIHNQKQCCYANVLKCSRSLSEEKKLLKLERTTSQEQDGVCLSQIDTMIWLLERTILVHSKNRDIHTKMLKEAQKLRTSNEAAALKGKTQGPYCLINSLEKETKIIKKTLGFLNKEVLDARMEREQIRKKHKDELEKKRRLAKSCDERRARRVRLIVGFSAMHAVKQA